MIILKRIGKRRKDKMREDEALELAMIVLIGMVGVIGLMQLVVFLVG